MVIISLNPTRGATGAEVTCELSRRDNQGVTRAEWPRDPCLHTTPACALKLERAAPLGRAASRALRFSSPPSSSLGVPAASQAAGYYLSQSHPRRHGGPAEVTPLTPDRYTGTCSMGRRSNEPPHRKRQNGDTASGRPTVVLRCLGVAHPGDPPMPRARMWPTVVNGDRARLW